MTDAWDDLVADLEEPRDPGDWVPLAEAVAAAGVSRSALRTWFRTGQLPSRMEDGPHGPQRLVPLGLVLARSRASDRLTRRLAAEPVVTASDPLTAMVEALTVHGADRERRLEERADRLEGALRDALARAAAAEAEREVLRAELARLRAARSA